MDTDLDPATDPVGQAFDADPDPANDAKPSGPGFELEFGTRFTTLSNVYSSQWLQCDIYYVLY